MAMRSKTRKGEDRLAFQALSVEGALLSPDWLSRIARCGAGHQSEADYRVPHGIGLRDQIGGAWRVAQAHWGHLTAGMATGADRSALAEGFVYGLLRDGLGFVSLARVEPVMIAERSYPIGFAALGRRVPVVIAPAGSGLDTLAPRWGDGGRRQSASGLLQEFLNAAEGALWGLTSDGLRLRILRDNASLTRPAWIEVDLWRIFGEERYADFAALWLLAHETRFGCPENPTRESPLEVWRNAGREAGTRAREHLQRGVEAALVAFGQGFLGHPENQGLRRSLESGALPVGDYFGQLLRLVYRLIFLLTIEERGLLHPENADPESRQLYAAGYSLRRLSDRALTRGAHDRYSDLWEAMKIVFRGLANGESRLALPALLGIFAASECPALDAAQLENRGLLLGVFHLAWLREDSGLLRVNWRDLGPEELGSVYQGLLELTPETGEDGRRFGFVSRSDRQHARRATGSYYTPENLVRMLLDRALDPVIRRTVSAHPHRPADALLELSIVDPTCGSGHFLLAAGRRLAASIAEQQAQGTPSAAEYRRALRQVVGHCLFGVDLNPLAIELCKLSLWMEAVDPGRPLSFLDSHLRQGNALLGATPELLGAGIPDSAWEPVPGGDKKIAQALKLQNQRERTELTLALDHAPLRPEKPVLAGACAIEAASDANPTDLRAKEQAWDALVSSPDYDHARFLANAWCAAFVWQQVPGKLRQIAPTEGRYRAVEADARQLTPALQAEVAGLEQSFQFFHWHLAFPQIFARGGFDVVLGNPPWIAHAGRAAQPLSSEVKKFCRTNYPSFAGYPTTHGMFVTLAARLLRPGGALGILVPSSVSELANYQPTRRAHDQLCEVTEALVDFGEGQFPGVTQPCMALVSRRREGGRTEGEPGAPWPMERPDLDPSARALLARLVDLPPLPPELFGERGFQSDSVTQHALVTASAPSGRFTTALRGGTEVREFQLLSPRTYADPAALRGRLRGTDEYQAVRFLVRNTARYPIAALSDGQAFRNSLLAGYESTAWPAAALVALLNSALVRWQHTMRFRDARQPVLPQVKIGHLRSIPRPPAESPEQVARLRTIGERLSRANTPPTSADRAGLDALVFSLYEVEASQHKLVTDWHRRVHESVALRRSVPASK
jgi:hypothetical protein